MFTLEANDPHSNARAGRITTDHGEICTPIFMPVGTQGTVKAIEQRELLEMGAHIILGNTYHLYLRPSEEVLSRMGGLHSFMNWTKPILTDSGGFQVFSLKELMKLSEDGAAFSSHIDGSKHFFSPERVMEIQRCIGSDIMMLLDECTSFPATHDEAKRSMERSMRWAKRCKTAVENSDARYGARQFAFGIGQGSVFKDLRADSIAALTDIGFDGYAIGGLAVGEQAEIMYDIVEHSTGLLPKAQARYLMGVGTPQNILECIERGVDMFDCVMPTRNARNAQLFTTKGRINLRNAKHRFDETPIDTGLENYASNNFSRAYLRHLFMADEILALQLASQHNIAFYLWLTRTAREHIFAGTFTTWKREFLAEFTAGTAQ